MSEENNKITECRNFPKSYDNCMEILDYGYNKKDKNGYIRNFGDVDCRDLEINTKLQCARRKMNWSNREGGTEQQRKLIKQKYEPMIRRICETIPKPCSIRPYKDVCPCNDSRMNLKDVPKKIKEYWNILDGVFDSMGITEAKKELSSTIPLKTKDFEKDIK